MNANDRSKQRQTTVTVVQKFKVLVRVEYIIPLFFLACDEAAIKISTIVSLTMLPLIAFSCAVYGFGQDFVTCDASGYFAARSIPLHEREETAGSQGVVCHDWLINAAFLLICRAMLHKPTFLAPALPPHAFFKGNVTFKTAVLIKFLNVFVFD